MLAFCVPGTKKSFRKGGCKMLALFIFLAVLLLAHGLAVGAYLSLYKMKAKTVAGKSFGTLVIGGAYTLLITFAVAVLILPPIG